MHTLLHAVACCCTKFETSQTLSPVQTDATLLADKSQHYCWELLRPFARNSVPTTSLTSTNSTTPITLKVILHGTIRNDDFYRNTELQCWNNVVTIRNNAATLCCAKNRLCKSSRVTSPLLPAQLSHDHSFLNQHIYLKWGVFSSPLPYPSPPPHTHTQAFLFCFGFFSPPTSALFTFVVQLNCGLSPKNCNTASAASLAQVDKCWSVEREVAGSNRGGSKSQGH